MTMASRCLQLLISSQVRRTLSQNRIHDLRSPQSLPRRQLPRTDSIFGPPPASAPIRDQNIPACESISASRAPSSRRIILTGSRAI